MGHRRYSVILLIAACLSAACGSSPVATAVDETSTTAANDATTSISVDGTSVDTTAPPTTPSTNTEPDIEQVALDYSEDVANARYSENAEPGSPAEWYSIYLDSTGVSAEQTAVDIAVVDGDVRIETDFTDGTSGVITITEFEIAPAGVRDFVIEGRKMSDRIAVSTTDVSVKGIGVDQVISYQALSGKQFVAASITNTNEASFNVGGPPSFVDLDGRQIESEYFISTYEIRPGATGVVSFVFPGGSSPAGTIYMDGSTNDYLTQVPLVFEVSAIGS